MQIIHLCSHSQQNQCKFICIEKLWKFISNQTADFLSSRNYCLSAIYWCVYKIHFWLFQWLCVKNTRFFFKNKYGYLRIKVYELHSIKSWSENHMYIRTIIILRCLNIFNYHHIFSWSSPFFNQLANLIYCCCFFGITWLQTEIFYS